MVKFFSIFLLLLTLLQANSYEYVEYNETGDALEQKIKSYISSSKYNENSEFINILFSPKSSFYKGANIDDVKVVSTLNNNGLLKLHFSKQRELKLDFKTEGSSILFLKIMRDALRNIGYYKHITVGSSLDEKNFTWSIKLKSDNALKPQSLQKELRKVGCKIVNIVRKTSVEWSYKVDISNANLRVPTLRYGKKLTLKRSLYAHWINVKNVTSLIIKSSSRNRWYPNISYYDAKLKLIEVLKKENRTNKIYLNIPQGTKYIKISDVYTLKNIKDYLTIYPK